MRRDEMKTQTRLFLRTTAVRIVLNQAGIPQLLPRICCLVKKHVFIQTFGLNHSLSFTLFRIFEFASSQFYSFLVFHFFSSSVLQFLFFFQVQHPWSHAHLF